MQNTAMLILFQISFSLESQSPRRSWKEFSGLNSGSCPTICLTLPFLLSFLLPQAMLGCCGRSEDTTSWCLILGTVLFSTVYNFSRSVSQKVTQFDDQRRIKCHYLSYNRLQGSRDWLSNRGPQHNESKFRYTLIHLLVVDVSCVLVWYHAH